MRVNIKIVVYAVSEYDHDQIAELMDELQDVENYIIDEFENYGDIEFSINEGIEGEDDKGKANALSVLSEAREEHENIPQ